MHHAKWTGYGVWDAPWWSVQGFGFLAYCPVSLTMFVFCLKAAEGGMSDSSRHQPTAPSASTAASLTPEEPPAFLNTSLQCSLFPSLYSLWNRKQVRIHSLCLRWSGFFLFYSLLWKHLFLHQKNMSKAAVFGMIHAWTLEYLLFFCSHT